MNKPIFGSDFERDSPVVFLSLKSDVAVVNKVCPRCGESKPIEEFAIDRSKSNGRKSHCKDCDNAKSRDYYAENRKRVIGRVLARYRRLQEGS